MTELRKICKILIGYGHQKKRKKFLNKSKEECKKEIIQLWSSCPTCNEAIEGGNFENMDHVCSVQCTSCLKRYRTEDKLWKHKEKHGRCQQTLKPTYFCDFCKKSVKHFARHKREAHGIGKPVVFPCSTCGKEFVRKFDLKKHMPKCRCPSNCPVQCDGCPMRYETVQKLRNHKQGGRCKKYLL